MSNLNFSVSCPRCGVIVKWVEENRFRPFCSKRCQLIDLGEWANEGKAISAEDTFLDTKEQ